MPFSQSVREEAFNRAGGFCECVMSVCGHSGRCLEPLGDKWEAHHKTSEKSGGEDTLGNCVAMCELCHKNTRTYGSS